MLQMTLPTIPEEERFEVEALAMPGFFRVLCRMGYTERLIRNSAFLECMNQALVEDIRFKALAAKCARRLLTCVCMLICNNFRVQSATHAALNTRSSDRDCTLFELAKVHCRPASDICKGWSIVKQPLGVIAGGQQQISMTGHQAETTPAALGREPPQQSA